jgi:hypothetical protein
MTESAPIALLLGPEVPPTCICRTPRIAYNLDDRGDVCTRCGKPWNPKFYRTGPAEKESAGRNEPCPCGSGRKYKRCCWAKGIYR